MMPKSLFFFFPVALLFCGCRMFVATTPEDKAKELFGDSFIKVEKYGDFQKTVFKFDMGRGFIVEPTSAPKLDENGKKCWVWCMKWPDAFKKTTGQYECLRRGYTYLYFEHMLGMPDEDLPMFKRFKEYAVEKFGLAPKASLIGMSWGGFYSIRYASAYPEDVLKIYLDNPLLTFDGFKGPTGWKKTAETWSEMPDMPVNLAEPVAKAGIPILLFYGDKDIVCPPELNCLLFAERFEKAGGKIQKVCRIGCGHHPHGYIDQIDFFDK